MRRQYFAHYYKNFSNTYNLMYADTKEELKLVPEDAKRITRKKAESLLMKTIEEKLIPVFLVSLII